MKMSEVYLKSRRDMIEAISHTILNMKRRQQQNEEQYLNGKISPTIYVVEAVYYNNEIDRLQDLRLEKLSEYDRLVMEKYNA